MPPETEAGHPFSNSTYGTTLGTHPAASNRGDHPFSNISCGTTLGNHPAARNKGGTVFSNSSWTTLGNHLAARNNSRNLILQQLLPDHSGSYIPVTCEVKTCHDMLCLDLL